MSVSVSSRQPDTFLNRVDRLIAQYEKQDGDAILRAMIMEEFPGRIAVVSSFGAESAVLLHKIAQIDPTVPVIFLNTGKLFGETLRYRDRLQQILGLADLRTLAPHKDDVADKDPDGDLWSKNGPQCCHIRKVLPQERALRDFAAVISGRKRFQTQARRDMQYIEVDNADKQRIRINPLADYDLPALNKYMDAHKLPRHPLVKEGYLSIGCMPCTDKVADGEDYRSGRWANEEREECGMHKPQFVYGAGI